MVRIAINGAGRIGRMVMRLALNDPSVEIVALNDPFMDAASFTYLFKYDSVHGRFKGDITHEGNSILLEGKKIKIFTEKQPTDIAWDEEQVDIVLECTGRFKDLGAESAGGHHSGAKNQNVKAVIISCPAGNGVPTFVMGVNQENYDPSMKVISNASCTTNCLAPVAKVLNDNWGIENGLMTTVHAATATQVVVDGASKKDYRGGRSVFNNLIPSSTGAAKAVGLVIPELKGKLTGMSIRVPSPDVSVVDLTVTLKKPATYEEIKAAMKLASETTLKGTLAYTEDDVVSSDFVGETHTSVFDAKAGIALNDQFVKIVSWYDNEVGYSFSLINLAKHVSSKQ